MKNKLEFTAKELADVLNGRVVGDSNIVITEFARIESGKPGSLTFLANMKYEDFIYRTQSSIALVNEGFEPKMEIKATLIYVTDAYAALAKLMRMAERIKKTKRSGISWNSRISRLSKVGKHSSIGAFSYVGKYTTIGKNCIIHPQCYIGNYVTIGDDVLMLPGSKVMDGCVIGNRCELLPGAVVGADGFGWAPENGEYHKIPQIGNVILEDDVSIGANSCVDRATMGSTIVRKGVKLDNLVQIAHNVEMGAHTVMAALSGVAGSTKIGDHCMIGGQVGIVNHLTLGSNVKIAAQTGVTKSFPNDLTLRGYPAESARNWTRSMVNIRKLPELYSEVEALKKELESLKSEINKK